MNKFYNKLQQIEEALSFSNTFKAPDENEKAIRGFEQAQDELKKKNGKKHQDGSVEVYGSVFYNGLYLTNEQLKSLKIKGVLETFIYRIIILLI